MPGLARHRRGRQPRQFIAGDFRRFIDLAGLTHVRTSVNYPQSNGSAIGYITTRDKLLGRETEIWAERDRRLEAARARRSKRRELDHLGTAA